MCEWRDKMVVVPYRSVVWCGVLSPNCSLCCIIRLVPARSHSHLSHSFMCRVYLLFIFLLYSHFCPGVCCWQASGMRPLLCLYALLPLMCSRYAIAHLHLAVPFPLKTVRLRFFGGSPKPLRRQVSTAKFDLWPTGQVINNLYQRVPLGASSLAPLVSEACII